MNETTDKTRRIREKETKREKKQGCLIQICVSGVRTRHVRSGEWGWGEICLGTDDTRSMGFEKEERLD